MSGTTMNGITMNGVTVNGGFHSSHPPDFHFPFPFFPYSGPPPQFFPSSSSPPPPQPPTPPPTLAPQPSAYFFHHPVPPTMSHHLAPHQHHPPHLLAPHNVLAPYQHHPLYLLNNPQFSPSHDTSSPVSHPHTSVSISPCSISETTPHSVSNNSTATASMLPSATTSPSGFRKHHLPTEITFYQFIDIFEIALMLINDIEKDDPVGNNQEHIEDEDSVGNNHEGFDSSKTRDIFELIKKKDETTVTNRVKETFIGLKKVKMKKACFFSLLYAVRKKFARINKTVSKVDDYMKFWIECTFCSGRITQVWKTKGNMFLIDCIKISRCRCEEEDIEKTNDVRAAKRARIEIPPQSHTIDKFRFDEMSTMTPEIA
ncbi:hypothetical protein DASC09_059940 [Saccharomycopsis crataegensis]|uniref:Uncharacterized protein n=1 Tax=Saccharomycopsis crataegensis TaxID=43959 RepID=A0AAV5QVM0_9ASCO|nr:hypothetical protein DASC09_059940 [Saccharomycopsis crataegensis]